MTNPKKATIRNLLSVRWKIHEDGGLEYCMVAKTYLKPSYLHTYLRIYLCDGSDSCEGSDGSDSSASRDSSASSDSSDSSDTSESSDTCDNSDIDLTTVIIATIAI